MSAPEVTEFDALIKIRPAEPYFALLGRDPLAPKLIIEWAAANRDHALKNCDGKVQERELRQSTAAEQVAWQMDDYRNGKVEVQQARQKGTDQKPYSGLELDDDTLARARETSARIKTVTALNNAIAEINDHAELISQYDAVCSMNMLTEVRRLKEISEAVAVKRAVIG